MIEFNKCTKEEMNENIDAIKSVLKEKAPEWSVHAQLDMHKRTIYYHLARHDFSEGPDKTWDIPLHQWIFASENPATGECALMNVSPIEHIMTLPQPWNFQGEKPIK